MQVECSPLDWPENGPINLERHDTPHQTSATEWWYFNTHFKTHDEQQFSLFACFFIKRKSPQSTEYSHSGMWALSCAKTKTYHTYACIDRDTPHIFLEKIAQVQTADTALKQALEEVLKKGKVPSCDEFIDNAIIHTDPALKLQFAEMTLEKLPDGKYALELKNKKKQVRCHLIFTPQKPPARQGQNGIVSGANNEQMFHYFIPRYLVNGQLEIGENCLKIASGQGWYDREFGVEATSVAQEECPMTWTWMSIQLQNGYDISVYRIYDATNKKIKNFFVTVIDPRGTQEFFSDVTFNILATWKSFHTFNHYATRWQLSIPAIQLNLEICAGFEDQEFITLLSYPGFWEGGGTVSGDFQGKPIQGSIFIEQTNVESLDSIEDFFHSVSEEVATEIQNLLPLQPHYHQYLDLIASQDKAYLLEGVDLEQFIRTVVLPLRTICDRGGKRWRSYALIACCNLVGGNFQKFRKWLAVPELIHTGSLIIDDVQDQSLMRRGGPACHVLFGEAHSINAGTLAYALFHIILKQTDLTPSERCKIYELYFDTFRAAHTGQAIDIDGHLDCMKACMQTGNFTALRHHVFATHRLKTAVVVASLARIGAILGKGSETQIENVGHFFESLGIAFQMIDDVLNIRGFKNNLKTIGEDLQNGKVTYPIVKLLESVDAEEQQWILHVLTQQSKDMKSYAGLIERLETSGALSACSTEARALLDKAWMQFDPLFEESHTKTMLRAFCHFTIERHY